MGREHTKEDALGRQIPAIDYLVLKDGDAHLVARECDGCHALYFERRNGCGRCGGQEFSAKTLATHGSVRAFTFVYRTAAGRGEPSREQMKEPFVSVIVDLDDGGDVKANLLGFGSALDQVRTGMRVQLETFVAGVDGEGTEAIAFGFVPEVNGEERT